MSALAQVIETRPERGEPPHIGARWKPGHVIRRDSERGTYEELNPPMETQAESLVQRALLAGRRVPLVDRITAWMKGRT